MRYDPATTESQEAEEDRLDAITIAFETATLAIIAEALGRITPETTYTEALVAQASDMAKIQSLASATEAEAFAAVDAAFARMATGNDNWAKKYYKHVKRNAVATAENFAMKMELAAGKLQAKREVRKLVNPSVIGTGKGATYKPLATAYQNAVRRGVTAMAVGESTYTREISRITKEFASSGLRVQFQSGRTMELSAAVNFHLMNGYRDTMVRLRELHGIEFGADGVEISAHPLCAPDHLPYQGQQYPKAEYEDINRGLSRPIESGANCRHRVSPVRLGVPPAYTDEQLEEMKAQSTDDVTFTGTSGKPLTMSRYEASQYQRGLERSVRQSKTEAYMAKVEKQSDAQKAANKAARDKASFYRSFCKETGLTVYDERLRIFVK